MVVRKPADGLLGETFRVFICYEYQCSAGGAKVSAQLRALREYGDVSGSPVCQCPSTGQTP